MNPLVNKFPTKIQIGDTIHEINTDFRNCLKIILAYEDDDLTIEEKTTIMLMRLYGFVPKNAEEQEEAIKKGILFLDCGEEHKDTDSPRIYSFFKDGKYIYAAIESSNVNLDLENIEYLHWWKFCYKFLEIGKNTTFSNIISLRDKKNKGKLTKEERNIFIESREILDLDYISEPSEEENKFMNLFNGGEEESIQKEK